VIKVNSHPEFRPRTRLGYMADTLLRAVQAVTPAVPR
jgi:hypothetical protein